MSDAAKKGGSGRQKGPEPKKDSGGFWDGVVEGFVGRMSAPQESRRNPADPVERMEPVRQDRAETGREMIFRASEGAAGQAPMERVDRERRYVARAVAGRGESTRSPAIPQAGGSPLPA